MCNAQNSLALFCIPKPVCHFVIGLHGCNRGINYSQNMGKGRTVRRAMEICLYSAQAVGIKDTLFGYGEDVEVWKL